MRLVFRQRERSPLVKCISPLYIFAATLSSLHKNMRPRYCHAFVSTAHTKSITSSSNARVDFGIRMRHHDKMMTNLNMTPQQHGLPWCGRSNIYHHDRENYKRGTLLVRHCSSRSDSDTVLEDPDSDATMLAEAAVKHSENDDDVVVSEHDNIISKVDASYMNLAIRHARIGFGGTFPNPAVGCVLVQTAAGEDDEEDVILGQGFHPKAGMPHAEVFALLEAAGHVEDGVEAAKSVMTSQRSSSSGGEDAAENHGLAATVDTLLAAYSVNTSEGEGARTLFQHCLGNHNNVTAYVTLEPCCHVGRTPPCAESLLLAGVKRVVVGARDPNPRVDGGGIQLLRDGGVRVDCFDDDDDDKDLRSLVDCFVKRIQSGPPHDYDDFMTGRRRRRLRSLANRYKAEGSMPEWTLSSRLVRGADPTNEGAIIAASITVAPSWMEGLDALLWERELVSVKMTKAFKKKRECQEFGEGLATELNAHIVQVLGKTVLLYRPAQPKVLELDDGEEDGEDDNSL